MVEKKSYTVESSAVDITGGRYKSSSPSGAAKKAARMLFRKCKKKVKKIRFVIRETTSGSGKKTFEYTATRTKLAKPVVRVLDGVKVVNQFKYSVKPCARSMSKGGDCGCGSQ